MKRPPAVASGRLLAALLALLVLCALPALAAASERILSYDVIVEVKADGSMEVTEHIRVRAEGRNIRRGLYRDFPTRYKDKHGNNLVVGFKVLGVERDGQPVPWAAKGMQNGVRVTLGGNDLLPVPLDTTYTLRYRATRQLSFLDDHDELYWNAIGQGWQFRIDTGSVEIRLPQPVPPALLATDGFSGRYGMRGRDFEARITAPGVARWELTHPLQAREGLSVVLSFPKGIVQPPGRAQRLAWLLRDNLSLAAAACGLLALLVFCALRWHRIGRDPEPGVIIARYEPPRGESPAALRYMLRRGYDTTCMSAELLACAVKGALTIERSERPILGDRWTLRRGGVPASAIGNADERRLLDALLPPTRARLDLEKESAGHVQAAIGSHSQGLAKRFRPAMFRYHGGSIAIAALIFALTLATTVLLAAASGGGGMPWALAPLALALAVLVAFALLVGAPTAEGRRLLDEIEGFKRYLSVAEQDDLARLQGPGAGAPPMLDAARFEAMLPYAVALGVEDAWTAKFTAAVGAAAATAAAAGIAWYRGNGGTATDIGSFTSSIGGALSARISSSSSPPGSSSGMSGSSGGGGFSGGGGGGGGGGGR